jgi:hypothetical protein
MNFLNFLFDNNLVLFLYGGFDLDFLRTIGFDMSLYFKNRLQGLEELAEEQFGVWLLMANEFTQTL